LGLSLITSKGDLDYILCGITMWYTTWYVVYYVVCGILCGILCDVAALHCSNYGTQHCGIRIVFLPCGPHSLKVASYSGSPSNLQYVQWGIFFPIRYIAFFFYVDFHFILPCDVHSQVCDQYNPQ
jgi:hypothetical protein